MDSSQPVTPPSFSGEPPASAVVDDDPIRPSDDVDTGLVDPLADLTDRIEALEDLDPAAAAAPGAAIADLLSQALEEEER